MDDLRLPTDLEINLMVIQQEYLNNQYDIIKGLVVRHEAELAILWCITLGLLGATMVNSYTTWKAKANG